VVCVLISTSRGVFIGVQGGVIDLVKLVTRQVMAGWPSHVAGRPGDLATRQRPRPIGQRPLHTASSCQLCPQGDTYCGGIPNFLVIS
jgi:hypothetical protein